VQQVTSLRRRAQSGCIAPLLPVASRPRRRWLAGVIVQGVPAAGGEACNAPLKGRPYSITERRVPALIPVLCSQPARDVSHKPGGRLPLLSVRPAVRPTLATLKRAVTNFAAW